MAHHEAEWLSQQNILIFTFSYFTIFSSTCRHNFGRTVARKSLSGARHSENLYVIHKTAFTNCAN